MATDGEQGLLQGRYRLEQRLASGGMAEVYRAVDLHLGRPVAVKLLHPHLASDPAFVERLRSEARFVAGLAHPNVVGVYDTGESDGRPFLVMELVEGESLAELIARAGQIEVARALAIAGDVLRALEHAHGRGVLHRDVKPQNILLAPGGRAKLVDFGIAQSAAAASLTRAGEVFGSVHYLAPERLTGQPATPAADLYAVGVVLYQMLTGALPFEGDHPAAIAALHERQTPVPPSTVRPALPRWLDEAILTALAKDPGARFPSAAAMRKSLERGAAEPVDAAPTIVVPIATPSPARPVPTPGGKRSGRRLPIYPVALATALSLAVLGLMCGREPLGTTASSGPLPAATPAPSPATQAAPTASTKPPTPGPTPSPTSATATPTAPSVATPTIVPPDAQPAPTIAQRLNAIRALVQNLGGRNTKAAREILKQLGEIEQKIASGDTKDARADTRDLIKKIQDFARKGELDGGVSQQLVAQLTTLAERL